MGRITLTRWTFERSLLLFPQGHISRGTIPPWLLAYLALSCASGGPRFSTYRKGMREHGHGFGRVVGWSDAWNSSNIPKKQASYYSQIRLATVSQLFLRGFCRPLLPTHPVPYCQGTHANAVVARATQLRSSTCVAVSVGRWWQRGSPRDKGSTQGLTHMGHFYHLDALNDESSNFYTASTDTITNESFAVIDLNSCKVNLVD